MTKEFYDLESRIYSSKRYFGLVDSYPKFFFRRRLETILALVEKITSGQKGLTLLEIGCADGVVLKRLVEKLPRTFTKLVGVDISSAMITQAEQNKTDNRFHYHLRGAEPKESFDLILSVGYLTPQLFAGEFRYVKERLNSKGYYLCSQAGRFSIHGQWRVRKEPYFKDYLSYCQIEKLIKKDFEIIARQPIGFYLPKLWRFPALARLIQLPVDKFFSIFGRLTQELFHETIYLLQKNTD